MSPEQFLQGLARGGPAPAYLFVGPEAYDRERCRKALLSAVLGDEPEARENGLSRLSLDEVPLSAALDDARALSLFAARRVIWVGGAELALPRGRASSAGMAAEASPLDDKTKSGPDSGLADYLSDPSPDTVV